MKPSHFVTPRQLEDASFIPSHDPIRHYAAKAAGKGLATAALVALGVVLLLAYFDVLTK